MVEYCPMRIHHLSFQCSSSGSLDIYLKKLIYHGKVINPRGLTIFYRIFLKSSRSFYKTPKEIIYL